MKPRLPTATFTIMTKKKKFNDMAPTWHQRGQFEQKFKKVVRCCNFFQKWVILTQNSKTEVSQVKWAHLTYHIKLFGKWKFKLKLPRKWFPICLEIALKLGTQLDLKATNLAVAFWFYTKNFLNNPIFLKKNWWKHYIYIDIN